MNKPRKAFMKRFAHHSLIKNNISLILKLFNINVEFKFKTANRLISTIISERN